MKIRHTSMNAWPDEDGESPMVASRYQSWIILDAVPASGSLRDGEPAGIRARHKQ